MSTIFMVNISLLLREPYKFETNVVSEIVDDSTVDLTLVDAKLKESGILESSLEERRFGIARFSFVLGFFSFFFCFPNR
jgi:hypothetical protein